MKHARQGIILLLLLCVLLLVTGCAWNLLYALLGAGCDVSSDPHCSQNEAIASSDPTTCEKVTAPAEYAKLGTDPPKDKCYLEVAENTGNDTNCAKMQGGPGGYEPSECYTKIAEDKLDPTDCAKITGETDTTPDECYQAVGAKGGTPDKCAGLSGSVETDCRTGIARGANSEG